MANLDENIAKIASLIGDNTRAAILIALMEGRALTAGELALRANISPQTASNHLKKLQAENLIEYVKTPTRFRYYRISSPLVGQALEALSLLTTCPKKRPPKHDKLDHSICFARTCYDHLAGEMGVKLANRLQASNYIILNNENYDITDSGVQFLASLDIDIAELKKKKRQLTKACLDWTEREFHIGGALGAALFSILLKNDWVRQAEKSRVVYLTLSGQHWFDFKIDTLL